MEFLKINLSPRRISGIIVLLIVSRLIYIPLDFYLSHGFKSYLQIVFMYGRNELKDELLGSEIAEYVFMGLKVVPILVFIWFGLIWIDFLKEQRLKATRFFAKTGDTIYFSLLENKKYIIDLGKTGMYTLLIILGTQFVFYTYFLLTIPLIYDEWWSFNYFSFCGAWSTLCYYPLPNNHVFFNLVSGLFLNLPIDIEISLRLPSLIASFISVFYFFKICKYSFNNSISFLLIVFVISTFPFISYAFSARGYAFSCLFYILMIYSSIKLFNNYKSRKYRYLFLISLYFGLFSLPSFLYAFLPIAFVFGFYLIKQKRFSELTLLIKDSFIGLILTLASYLFILFFNNPENLLNPNRLPPNYFIKAPGSVDNIINHLKSTAVFFHLNEKVIFVSTILIIISTCIFVYKVKGIMRYICILSFAMVFSPVYLLVIHGQIPFERTWIHLIFPIALCIGFIIKNLVYYLEKITSIAQFTRLNLYFQSTLLIVCVSFLLSFKNHYKNFAGRIDFQFDELKEKHLKYLMKNVKKIEYTEVSNEFYLTGMISAIRYKYVPEKRIEMNALGSITDQDILIIDRTVLSKYYKSLKNYKVLKYIDDGRIIVYAKTDLICSK